MVENGPSKKALKRSMKLTKSDNVMMSPLASQDGHGHRERHRRDAVR